MAMAMTTLLVMVAMVALVPQGMARHFLVQTGEEGGEVEGGPGMKKTAGDYSMHPGEDMMDMAAMKAEIRKMRELEEKQGR